MSPWERGAYGRTETPDQARAMRAMFRGGTPAKTIAETFGIHVRTVYRAIKRADRDTFWVSVGAWQAEFTITEFGPVQVGRWLPDSPARARAKDYDEVVGVSDTTLNTATMRDGAARGAYSTEGRAAAFSPGVRR